MEAITHRDGMHAQTATVLEEMLSTQMFPPK
jgi:hypothetical protein